MSKLPFIGAIVHYVVDEGHDIDDNPIRTCQAAMITRMPASYANPYSVDLTVLCGSLCTFEPHTIHALDNEEMTWHWPEECLLDGREKTS